MSSVILFKKYTFISAVVSITALVGLTSCKATMNETKQPTLKASTATFGGIKSGAKNSNELGVFEKTVVPKTGFVLLVGGTTSRSTAYILDVGSSTLKVVVASEAGRAVNISKDMVKTIKVREELMNEMLRLSNLIWKTDKSFSNFPPKSSSVNVRMILIDGDSIKDINSYGPAKFEINELFEMCAQYAAGQ
jgi:hypothetical protein